ncbi:hypothetical protein [Anditalea andensis]|uniref:Cytochrome c domain-containing protein n=1 Tax=Anditalea andensis TaxID=1048983 RepID=A0A074L2U9_9BACT|nr:hypothetical protein [Anditalea andensis]KEO74173.1 hypothetical protein EL17_08520 [Anditalea andensis]
MKNTFLFLLLAGSTLIACNNQSKTYPSGSDGWLTGTEEEKFEEVASQLGGFSRTMIEVAYRYSELYWAGQDENWDYADHQLEHLVEVLEDGLKRRPARAESAQDFLQHTVSEMEELIVKEEKVAFLEGFRSLTTACNACHAREGESFIVIREPEFRTSPVRF